MSEAGEQLLRVPEDSPPHQAGPGQGPSKMEKASLLQRQQGKCYSHHMDEEGPTCSSLLESLVSKAGFTDWKMHSAPGLHRKGGMGWERPQDTKYKHLVFY